MKRIPLLIALVLIFSFGLAIGQTGQISVVVDGLYNDGGTDKIPLGKPITYHITYTNDYENPVGTPAWQAGATNGFQVSGPAAWVPVTAAWVDLTAGGYLNSNGDAVTTFDDFFNLVQQFTLRSCNGSGADTVAVSVAPMTWKGMPPSFSDNVIDIFTQVDGGLGDDGEILCLDSSWFPSGAWLWAPAGVPTWDGPHCYETFFVPWESPIMTDCPGSYSGDHCVGVSIPLSMIVYDNEGQGALDNPRFEIETGVGAIVGSDYLYTPSLADVGAPLNVTVKACDDHGCGAVMCDFAMNFTNVAPEFTGGCGDYKVAQNNCKSITLTAAAVDCDPATMSLTGVVPTPDGLYSFDAVTGVFEFCPTTLDGGLFFDFTFGVTDGGVNGDGAPCVVNMEVVTASGFLVAIEKTHNTIQGQHEMVDVTFTGADDLYGFDILIAYDASALTLANVIPGDVFTECGWEYFTFRHGANGNCGNACPSGVVRVVGIAETNNGPNHPDVSCVMGGTLFTLDFLVGADYTFECMYVPIRFFWMDCGDNSVAYTDLINEECYFDMTLQGISRSIYSYEAALAGSIADEVLDPLEDIANDNVGYPTYLGAQNDCVGSDDMIWCDEIQDSILKPGPIRWVDFVNGGIDIVCADSIDARGDINLNNQAYEIADAVLFSNYFIHGLSVFTVNVAGQVVASDTNADGMVLSVADLVYLIRVVVGDALPYAKLNPVGASYIADNGFVSVDQAMGAAYVVVAGNVSPTLLAENMDMQYAFDGTNTRILVSSMEANQTFQGQFISVNGNVISVELATYDGAPVVAKQLPSAYALDQNYPNPFNPATTINFSLMQAGDYSLTIYNVTGQTVEVFAGSAEAGTHTISWDASNQASGIYFYKLSTDDFSDTKKMVLLK